jgi:hypothetical protein
MVPKELTDEKEFLASKQITVLEHPPFSQDLAPNDFFLFPKIKKILTGRHFDETDDIKSNTTAALKAIPQTNSKIVLKGGLGAGIGAELPKGCTLKATTVTLSNEICSTFTAMSSRTLLSVLVHRRKIELVNNEFERM